jgi:hypothetical protein
MTDRVDHRHDHETERDRHSDVAERMRPGVHDDRTRACEDERERADGFRDE